MIAGTRSYTASSSRPSMVIGVVMRVARTVKPVSSLVSTGRQRRLRESRRGGDHEWRGASATCFI